MKYINEDLIKEKLSSFSGILRFEIEEDVETDEDGSLRISTKLTPYRIGARIYGIKPLSDSRLDKLFAQSTIVLTPKYIDGIGGIENIRGLRAIKGEVDRLCFLFIAKLIGEG